MKLHLDLGVLFQCLGLLLSCLCCLSLRISLAFMKDIWQVSLLKLCLWRVALEDQVDNLQGNCKDTLPSEPISKCSTAHCLYLSRPVKSEVILLA